MFRQFKVKFDYGQNNCFISLPRHFVKNVEDSKAVIKISWINSQSDLSTAFLGWSWETNKEDYIIIPGKLAEKLNLKEGTLVNAILLQNGTIAKKVFVEPASLEDSQILELNQINIEENLLNQIFVLFPDLVFPLKIHNGITIFIRVLDIGDYEYIILDRNTELEVRTISIKKETTENTLFKVLPLENNQRLIEVHPKNILNIKNGDILKIKNTFLNAKVSKNLKNVETVLIPRDILQELDLKILNQVDITIYKDKPTPIIDILVKQTNDYLLDNETVQKMFTNWLNSQEMKNIPMSSSNLIHLNYDFMNHFMFIKIIGSGPMFMFNQDVIKKIKLDKSKETFILKDDPLDIKDYGIYDKLLEYGLNILKNDNYFIESSLSSLLIFGPIGSGRSSYAKLLARYLSDYTIYISCRSLAGSSPDQANGKLKLYFQEVFLNTPCTIIFDDLDSLLPLESEESPDLTVRVVSSLLIESLRKFPNHVKVIATVSQFENLHKIIQESNFFEEKLNLPLPDKESRYKLLKYLSDLEIKEETLQKLLVETENFAPLDIVNLINKMTNSALMGFSNEIKYQDYEKAISDFSIQSIVGTKLLKSDTKWEDIGGLKDVKRLLRETFEIPTKYSALFQKVPIKLRSGILIYGMPGTASAVSRECGLNFITVKGPELLNKYIGASEQGVRNVFQRAESAKPCIIFFDEFDSIASQRGKDNTGVTDRVVNQLLVQLDGVESRSGVYVLAATSRPDLIDSALLRPGRLDKLLYCPLPNLEERLEILQKLCKNVSIEKSVNLLEIAKKIENYTGADIQSLLYTAQIEATHEHSLSIVTKKKEYSNEPSIVNLENIFESLQIKKEEKEKITLEIQHKHFDIALEKTRASLSDQEIKRFETLYENFVSSKKQPEKKKVTLA